MSLLNCSDGTKLRFHSSNKNFSESLRCEGLCASRGKAELEYFEVRQQAQQNAQHRRVALLALLHRVKVDVLAGKVKQVWLTLSSRNVRGKAVRIRPARKRSGDQV